MQHSIKYSLLILYFKLISQGPPYKNTVLISEMFHAQRFWLVERGDCPSLLCAGVASHSIFCAGLGTTT